ncbi:U-Kazal-Dg21.2-like [Cochliomyia hominivorax]
MKCFYKPCHNYERTIFATDGSTCYVFRNSCHLRNENCRRIRSYAERLSTVTKEVCQAKCQQECPAGQGTPVCGEYAGLYTTFPSECELLRTACVNGQPIIKVRNSACPVYG